MSININILSNFNGTGFDKLTRELDRVTTPLEKVAVLSRSFAPAARLGLLAIGGLGAAAVQSASDMIEAQTAVVSCSSISIGSSTDARDELTVPPLMVTL